jgi:putative hydrolase of the HAD superfamily
MKKYKAVIFDLFGTLVPNMALSGHRDILEQMAHILSAPADDFLQLWFNTFNERCTGIFQTPDDNVEHICRTLGTAVDKNRVQLATRIRFDYAVRAMTPRPDAIETISHLKSKGCKIGLISDCSTEAPAIWPDTPLAPLFDTTTFSCAVGLKKPDPRIYRLTTEQMDVKPQDCLYIGDGSSNELTGAKAVGMHPVLIRDPDEDSIIMHRIDAEGEQWPGPVISSLSEILDLVK